MSRRPLAIIVAVALLTVVAMVGCYAVANAQTTGYTPCPREPLSARLDCIERTSQAALESRIIVGRLEHDLQTARLELQVARDELRAARAELAARVVGDGLSRQQVLDLLWGDPSARDWWYFRARAEGVK